MDPEHWGCPHLVPRNLLRRVESAVDDSQMGLEYVQVVGRIEPPLFGSCGVKGFVENRVHALGHILNDFPLLAEQRMLEQRVQPVHQAPQGRE